MPFTNFSRPLIIAHRGASHLAPENTIAAFEKAGEIGAAWVEFDVMLSRDGVAVVFHDDTLDRTTNGKGRLCDYPYSYLSTLDAGSWFNPEFAGERIPTFISVIEILKQRKLAANVEIKVPADADEAYQKQLVETVLTQIRDHWTPEMPPPLISSFSMFALRHVRELAPQAMLAVLLEDWFSGWQDVARALQSLAVNPDDKIVTREKVAEIHKMENMVLCYTVDDPRRAKELFDMGVDGVFTNEVSVISNELQQTAPRPG